MVKWIQKEVSSLLRAKWFRRNALYLFLLLQLALLPLYSEKNDYIGKVVESISFTGTINVSGEDLRSRLLTETGQPLTREALNKDIITLFDTGYFSNVVLRVDPQPDGKIRIYFDLEELPRVRSINFRGVDNLYTTDLIGVLPFKEGSVYSGQRINDGIQSLKRKYREEGYFLAEVWAKTGSLDKKTNSIDVTYVVDEGDDISISRINIIGAKSLNVDDMLKVVELKESSLLEDGHFDEGKYEEGKFRLVAYAKSQGHLDAEIDEKGTDYEIRWKNPRKPEEGRVVVVTYKINEAAIYYFGGYSLEFDKNYINQELNPPERKLTKPGDILPIYSASTILDNLEYTGYNTGDVFDETRFYRDRGFIQELYSQRGYVFAQVQPRFIEYKLTKETIDRYKQCLEIANPSTVADEKCREEASYIDLKAADERLNEDKEISGRIVRHVHFTVRENHLAYIENIIIKGMVKTQERVIRRQLLIKEGQLFNSALVNRSREMLVNTGFFKEVNLQMRPGSDDQKMNLIIDVQEQPTGTISMGGGYGTQSGFSIFLEGGENNLNGTGQQLNGRISYGPKTKAVMLGWTDPWFHEACEVNSGKFWRTRQKEFDDAESLDAISSAAAQLQNNYRTYGETIQRYVQEAQGDESVESLDRIKSRIRKLIYNFVETEEDCYRSMPRPWGLSLQAYYQDLKITADGAYSIKVSDVDYSYLEASTYQITTFGLSVGVSHRFLVNWNHYHVYSPSWSLATNATALVNNEILKRTKLGWQFHSSLRNGVAYDTRDNRFSPTTGFTTDMSLEIVGGLLGGDDHFNRYKVSARKYWWWFDYTMGGLFRNNDLRRWRVVQEVRFVGTFSHATAPYGKKQNSEINPYMEFNDRQFLGGYETLRGYNTYAYSYYPATWKDGGNHRLLFSTELRFPIEPSILWLVAFLDAGSLYDNMGEYTGDLKTAAEEYESNRVAGRANQDPAMYWITENYNLYTMKHNFFGSIYDWNDPRKSTLSWRNISLDRTFYSWGFGIRIQIPVLPLRLYMAQKLYHAGDGPLSFKPIPGDSKWEFVFGIGDYRFE